jgi:hypothetical protein
MERSQQFLTLGLCLMATNNTLGAPRERDTWHIYMADGKPYGSVHTRMIRLVDGNYQVKRDSQIL